MRKKRELRQLAQSKFHLPGHLEYNPECLGCQAKARNKKHYKSAFDRNNEEYANVVSMDQVNMTYLDGTSESEDFAVHW